MDKLEFPDDSPSTFDEIKKLKEKDITLLLNTIASHSSHKPALRFIITTIMVGDSIEELRKLNKKLDDTKFETYYNNLKASKFFNSDGTVKINISDEDLDDEINFARFVAEGIFKGEYVSRNIYKFKITAENLLPKKELEDREKAEKSECLFDYEWIKIMKDKETGTVYLKKNDSVVLIPFIDKKNVILERQYRPSIGKYTFEFPAGGIFLDSKTDLATAINKRFLKETGYSAGKIEYLFEAYPSPGIYNAKHYYYTVTDLKKVQEPEKGIEIKTFDFNQLEVYIARGEIIDSKTILAYLYYKYKNNLK